MFKIPNEYLNTHLKFTVMTQCGLFLQPMVLMRESSWQDLGFLLGGAGYTNYYPPLQYESQETFSCGNQTEISKHITST